MSTIDLLHSRFCVPGVYEDRCSISTSTDLWLNRLGPFLGREGFSQSEGLEFSDLCRFRSWTPRFAAPPFLGVKRFQMSAVLVEPLWSKLSQRNRNQQLIYPPHLQSFHLFVSLTFWVVRRAHHRGAGVWVFLWLSWAPSGQVMLLFKRWRYWFTQPLWGHSRTLLCSEGDLSHYFVTMRVLSASLSFPLTWFCPRLGASLSPHLVH